MTTLIPFVHFHCHAQCDDCHRRGSGLGQFDTANSVVTEAIRVTRAALIRLNGLENEIMRTSLVNQAFSRRLSIYEPDHDRSDEDPGPALNDGGGQLTEWKRSKSVALPNDLAGFSPLSPSPPSSTQMSRSKSRHGKFSVQRALSPTATLGESLASHKIDCLEYLLREERTAHQSLKHRGEQEKEETIITLESEIRGLRDSVESHVDVEKTMERQIKKLSAELASLKGVQADYTRRKTEQSSAEAKVAELTVALDKATTEGWVLRADLQKAEEKINRLEDRIARGISSWNQESLTRHFGAELMEQRAQVREAEP